MNLNAIYLHIHISPSYPLPPFLKFLFSPFLKFLLREEGRKQKGKQKRKQKGKDRIKDGINIWVCVGGYQQSLCTCDLKLAKTCRRGHDPPENSWPLSRSVRAGSKNVMGLGRGGGGALPSLYPPPALLLFLLLP
jgi:hypothetical protein